MKKILSVIICICTMLLILPVGMFDVSATSLYWENSTKEVTPDGNVYHIDSEKKLAWVMMQVNGSGNDFAGKTIVLDCDIDLDSRYWMPIGCYGSRDFSKVGMTSVPFRGTFDGHGFSVRGVNVNYSNTFWKYSGLDKWNYYNSDAHMGLFGVVDSATIKNVNVETEIYDSTAGECGHSGKKYNAGGLVGKAINNTNIYNCSASLNADITCRTTSSSEGLIVNVAGLIGMTESTIEGQSPKVENCFSRVH